MKANVGISLNSMISYHSLPSCENEKKRNDELQSLQLQLQEAQLHLQSLQHHYQACLEDVEHCFTTLSQITLPFQSSSFQSLSSIVTSISSSSCQLDGKLCDHALERMNEIRAEIWNEMKTARLELYSSVLSRNTIVYLCDEEQKQSEKAIINHDTVKNGFLGMVIEQFRMVSSSSSSWKSFEKCFHQLLSPYFSVLLCNTYADAKVQSYFSSITTANDY